MNRLSTLSLLAIAAAAGLLLALRWSAPKPPPLPPVVIMPASYALPRQRMTLFESWIPRSPAWAWLWRLKEQIAGRHKTIGLTSTIMDLTGSGTSFRTNFSLPKPQFSNTSGLVVWLLDDTQLVKLCGLLERTPGTELLAAPRITTADGMQASLFSGTSVQIDGLPISAGASVDLLGRVRPDATDLTLILNFSEVITNQPGGIPSLRPTNTVSIQTNLSVAARIQIPTATGVFLLDDSPSKTNRKRIGVVLSVTPPLAKK
jgi:hypothetical protein